MLIEEVDLKIAKFLATEVLKDLDYYDVYELANEALSRRFIRKNNIQSLIEDYGERYDYVFLEHGIDPSK